MNEQILEILKQKRLEIARREGKELFKIFHNSTLEETAAKLPMNKEELAMIKGWGQKKIKQYGNEIISVIKQSLKGATENISPADEIFSVGEVISILNKRLSSVGVIKVRGEITEVNYHPNGYCFFTIGDPQIEQYSINCYVSRWKLEGIDYLLEVGMEVVIDAVPSVYKNGRLNLTVNAVEPYGEGALKKAFEILKKKLAAKGYFDPSRKRKIPEFIQRIGLITSESGAAIRDFRKNLGQYGFKIYFMDIRVEGSYAEQSIISAIKWFNKNLPNIDVVVLTRGGGSVEDLKVFNSERVAEAIVLSRLPIITGIGHDKDETIADYVADKKLSPPTGAAVFIRSQREQLISQVKVYSDSLKLSVSEIISNGKKNLAAEVKNLEWLMAMVVERHKFLLSKIVERIYNGLNKVFQEFEAIKQKFIYAIYNYENNLRNKWHKIDKDIRECSNLIGKKLDLARQNIEVAEAKLLSLNPDFILKRGYSIVYTDEGHIVKKTKNIDVGQKIFIKIYKGEIISRVEELKD